MTCAEARSLLSLRLDNELAPDDEAPLREHLLDCASCQSVQREMAMEHHLLSQHWPAVAVPAGLSDRIARALPPRQAPSRAPRWLRRPAPALAGALALLLIAISVAIPPVRAGIGTLLESVSLRETSNPPAERRLGEGPVLTLDEAQQRVPWRIRTPGWLPEGYHLAGSLVDETEWFADGPTVALYYIRGDAADPPQIRIVQRRMLPNAKADLLLNVGAYTHVRVGGHNGLLVDGAWQQQDGQSEWVPGTLLRLIVEENDMLISLEADPRHGWDADGLIRVAESLW
jgi:hypothetical protein